MTKRFLVLLLLLIQLPLVVKPVTADPVKQAAFFYKFPLDATTMTYCVVLGRGDSPFATGRLNDFKIKTVGSTTTVTEDTASTNPFTDLAVGDLIQVDRTDGTTDVRVILARASAASVTVDSVVDWTGGFKFSWFKQKCGTAATDGWVDVSGYSDKTITFSLEQVNVTGGIDVRWECKGDSTAGTTALPVILYPGETDGCGGGTLSSGVCNFTTAGITSRTSVVSFEPWGACRLGVLIHTSDDGGDTGANEEQINGWIMLSRRN